MCIRDSLLRCPTGCGHSGEASNDNRSAVAHQPSRRSQAVGAVATRGGLHYHLYVALLAPSCEGERGP
eukprot:5490293-Alexandrium_andersonii.AAC.1